MKNTTRIGTKIASTLSLFAVGVGFAGNAHADRVRHCAYTFSAIVETQDLFANVVREQVVLVNGDSAGKHGGIQANTARERAKDRIVSCVGDWNDISSDLGSDELNACTNANISSVPGFDVKTDGMSFRETIAELLPGLCAELTCSEEVLVRVSEASLIVTGDKGCPGARDYQAEEMLVGEFCLGL